MPSDKRMWGYTHNITQIRQWAWDHSETNHFHSWTLHLSATCSVTHFAVSLRVILEQTKKCGEHCIQQQCAAPQSQHGCQDWRTDAYIHWQPWHQIIPTCQAGRGNQAHGESPWRRPSRYRHSQFVVARLYLASYSHTGTTYIDVFNHDVAYTENRLDVNMRVRDPCIIYPTGTDVMSST